LLVTQIEKSKMEKIDPKYIAFWRDHFNRQDAESRMRAARARKDLTKAIEILRKYGVKRIFLFGSLCRPDRFYPGSDIDLAAEGIPSHLFNRAAADLMMAMDWPIDLKPLEEVDDSFRSMILRKGEQIYAA
jgi:predicted nucleotidyltransferase